MKVLLTALNAKFIHSNLAVYSLRAYAQSFLDAQPSNGDVGNTDSGVHIFIAEYTINQQMDDVLIDIYQREPDLLCFSCYIWNISYIKRLVRECRKILPDTKIWLGGPEVSYNTEAVLLRLPETDGIMKGEGEETFAELISGKSLDDIAGITYRREDGAIISNPWRDVMDLNKVPFIYQDMTDFEHKIIYYESSRGCPFQCSYCLSSIDKKLRLRDIGLVKKELQFFIDREIPQVKFVDRTFNCNHAHAMEIWQYLIEHDKGKTNFHFEISADLLTKEEIRMINRMRPGLIQLEIGVQSTNPDTIREIHRSMRFDKVTENVQAIKAAGNVHQHLDLIAGLPYEDLGSFHRSFQDAYLLRPEQLQLGFLKVLKGSFMSENKKKYGLVHKSEPPYEVLYTKWLSYQDVIRLKGIEEMLEVYYNSMQFTETLPILEAGFSDAFVMYEQLAEYYSRCGLSSLSHSRAARYEILLAFASEKMPQNLRRIQELLTVDYYLRENAKNRPAFAGEYRMEKEAVRRFYEQESKEHRYLPGYEKYDKNQLRRMTHLEYFEKLGRIILFDYSRKCPMTGRAHTVDIEKCF